MEATNYISSGSDNDDEVEILAPPPKASTGIHRFKCLHCSLSFATRKEFMVHSETHAQSSNNPNPYKRTLTQREMGMQGNNSTNVPNGGVLMMNGASFNLAIAPLAKPVSLGPTRGAHVLPMSSPPGFPPKHPSKRPKNDHAEGGGVGGTSGTCGDTGGNGGTKGGNGSGGGGGGGGGSSGSGCAVKKVAFFDLNLPPPPEE